MKKRKISLVVLVTLCILIVVLLIRHPDRYVKREVDINEIVGVWNTTEDSCKNLLNEGYKLYVEQADHKLIFSDDGTCSVKTYKWLYPLPSKEEQIKNYSMDEVGTWKLVNLDIPVGLKFLSVRAVQIKITKVGFNSTHTDTLRWYIAEEDGRLVLWTYIGDIDCNNYQEFIKSTSPHDND